MKYFIIIFFIIIKNIYTTNIGGCNQDGAWNQTNFNDLLNKLKLERNEILRYEILKTSLTSQNKGFSSNQTLLILNCFNNEITIENILINFSPYILGMTCKDVSSLLKSMTNEILRLEVLPFLLNLTFDLRTNNQTIIDIFVNYFSKQKAKDLIEKAHPLSCVWGDVSPQRIIFIIDTSGSMSTQFTYLL